MGGERTVKGRAGGNGDKSANTGRWFLANRSDGFPRTHAGVGGTSGSHASKTNLYHFELGGGS